MSWNYEPRLAGSGWQSWQVTMFVDRAFHIATGPHSFSRHVVTNLAKLLLHAYLRDLVVIFITFTQMQSRQQVSLHRCCNPVTRSFLLNCPLQPRPVACRAQLAPSWESKWHENISTVIRTFCIIFSHHSLALFVMSYYSLAYLRLFFCVQVCATIICWWIKIFTQSGPKKRIILTPDKELNILIYWTPPYVITYSSYTLLKMVRFCLIL